MALSKTTLGHFELFTIETGDFMLDGGAMFGVVPKTLWSRGIEADEKNRIPMTMRCLLIRSAVTNRLYLIDNGCGTKFNEKMSAIYDIDHTKKNLEASFAEHGFTFDEVTDVIFSHLHFDHCGGTTFYDEDGEIQHTFPNANYHVLKRHWETATDPNAREKASFLKDNIEPIAASGRLNLIDDDNHVYEEGLSFLTVDGHTIGQQLPKIETPDSTVIFVADLLPTHVHIPLPWVMGYDMYPVQTLDEKERILKQAADHGWYFFLEHDIQKEIVTIMEEDGRFDLGDTYTLSDLN